MTKVTFNTPTHAAAVVTAVEFKAVCEELHDKLVEAGMTVADDTGQLNFSTITSLTGGANLGYRIYLLADGNSLPVYLKLRFVVSQGYGSAWRQPWALYVSIGLGTNGAGTLTQGTVEYAIGAPASYQSDRNLGGASLTSLICMAEGFLGVSWKQGITEGSASAGPSASDHIAIGHFFICRDTDDAGEVTSDGVSLVVIAPGGTIYNQYGQAPVVAHLDSAGTVIATRRGSLMMGADVNVTIDGKIPLSYMYTMTPAPRRIAQLLVAGRTPSSGVANDEMDARSVGTIERHFIVMNSAWPADVHTATGVRSCIAMLWE